MKQSETEAYKAILKSVLLEIGAVNQIEYDSSKIELEIRRVSMIKNGLMIQNAIDHFTTKPLESDNGN